MLEEFSNIAIYISRILARTLLDGDEHMGEMGEFMGFMPFYMFFGIITGVLILILIIYLLTRERGDRVIIVKS